MFEMFFAMHVATLLMFSVNVAASGSVRSAMFVADSLPTGGSPLCAVGNATRSAQSKSQAMCSDLCLNTDNCTSFNFRRESKLTDPREAGGGGTCELFDCPPTTFLNVTGCAHREVAGDEMTARLMKLEGCNILLQQHTIRSTAFTRPWAEYKVGFGNPRGDYWMGNDRLHKLTKDGRYKLRVDLQSIVDHQWYWAEYNTFVVYNESTNYTLHVGGYNGTAGDAIQYGPLYSLDGVQFSTFDRNNAPRGNFVSAVRAGFWYNCYGLALVNCEFNTTLGSEEYSFAWLFGSLPVTRVRSSLMYSRLQLVWGDVKNITAA